MIITLSTIPPRFDKLAPTLKSLLNQKAPADQIILYIPHKYRRFPEWEGTLPDLPEGISIRRTETDLGPATKILPAIKEFSEQDIDLLFCDDDVIYDNKWAQRYIELRKTMPNTCIAEGGYDIADINISARSQDRLPRVTTANRDLLFRLASMIKYRQRRASYYTKSGYCDIFLGVSGAMVRPAFFKPSVFEIPEILWAVDDYWLSGHLETNNIPIWLNADAPRRHDGSSRRIASLLNMVHDGHDRHASNKACIDYYRSTYGIWQSSRP